MVRVSPTLRPVLLVVGLAAVIARGSSGAGEAARVGRDGFDVTSGTIRALADDNVAVELEYSAGA